ncbi:MAG: amidohydrolase family protein [Candidatus Woesebacteria bacterium]|jgi:cytosine/adenosine deaminase-related metal-dependent hydrolase
MLKQNQNLLIENCELIYTVNQQRDVLEKTDIYLEDNLIKKIGKNLRQNIKNKINETIDASEMIALPGFINTHHHLFQTLFRGIDLLKKRPIVEWIQTLSALVEFMDEEAIDIAVKIGIAELLLSGCTTTSDHLYVFPHGRESLFDAEVKAAEKMAIRFHPIRGNLSVNEQGESLFPDYVLETEDQVLSRSKAAIEKYHDDSKLSMCRLGLGPCGIYSASKNLFEKIGQLAKKHQLNLHTHLLETADEHQLSKQLFKMDLFDFLSSTNFLGKHAWHAHAVYATKNDVKTLAKIKTGISYTPWCTTAKKQVTPVIQMLKHGVPVSIGTDGSAGNDASNLMVEARLAGRLQGMNQEVKTVSYLRATEILELLTIGGARCLGREDVLGSIEKNKVADLVLINIKDKLECSGCDNPLEAIFHTALNRVDYSIINGKIIVKQGQLNNSKLDLKKMIKIHNAIAKKVRQKAEKKLNKNLRLKWQKAFI